MLHNFAASALSLIDHTRKFYEEIYECEGKMPSYKSNFTFRDLMHVMRPG
jgi:hypothetical protein